MKTNNHIYYCSKNNNTCPKKDSCYRYVHCNENMNQSSLYKSSCTIDNNYILHIKCTNEIQDIGGEKDK